MTEVEVKERRTEMTKLIQDGLNLFEFPPDVINGMSGCARKLEPPPFIVMVGNESDVAVHPFWFVRKYRCVTTLNL